MKELFILTLASVFAAVMLAGCSKDDTSSLVVEYPYEKYGGKTMGQVAVESPSTIQWFAEQYSGPNNLVPAAAKVILQKAMPMAG